ncbi:hypothetical protein M0811_02734 [Anaeramoeba ignava]|uniref:Uncharacterized protein n=1 Tax=Anaeramoeba ignava TaxID=1746090 RepID=A0A9Q0L7K2_ANAIG|nr:hypothetical protein M0811_02734 [Anaeramoeba ignava]
MDNFSFSDVDSDSDDNPQKIIEELSKYQKEVNITSGILNSMKHFSSFQKENKPNFITPSFQRMIIFKSEKKKKKKQKKNENLIENEYKSETENEYKSETENEYKSETENEYKSETENEYKSEIENEYKSETENEYKSQSQSQSQTLQESTQNNKEIQQFKKLFQEVLSDNLITSRLAAQIIKKKISQTYISKVQKIQFPTFDDFFEIFSKSGMSLFSPDQPNKKLTQHLIILSVGVYEYHKINQLPEQQKIFFTNTFPNILKVVKICTSYNHFLPKKNPENIIIFFQMYLNFPKFQIQIAKIIQNILSRLGSIELQKIATTIHDVFCQEELIALLMKLRWIESKNVDKLVSKALKTIFDSFFARFTFKVESNDDTISKIMKFMEFSFNFSKMAIYEETAVIDSITSFIEIFFDLQYIKVIKNSNNNNNNNPKNIQKAKKLDELQSFLDSLQMKKRQSSFFSVFPALARMKSKQDFYQEFYNLKIGKNENEKQNDSIK